MCNSSLLEVAQRVCWFQSPEETLKNQRFFLNYVMVYAGFEDMKTVLEYYTKADFLDALTHALCGVFDKKSWQFWHIYCGAFEVPPLPKRRFPGYEPITSTASPKS